MEEQHAALVAVMIVEDWRRGSYGSTTVGEMQLFSWRDAQAAQRGGTRRGVGGRRHPTRRRPESGTDPGGEEPKDLNSQARFL